MEWMSALFVLAMASIVHGALLIGGPKRSVAEGDGVTLECSYSQDQFNISRVRFERFSKILQMWTTVWPASWCFYQLDVKQVENKMVLRIPRVAPVYDMVFRCASDDRNLSAPNDVSQSLSIKVNYLGDVYLSREGLISFLDVSKELRVQQGDDISIKCSASSSQEPNYCWYKEGDDWILPSSILTLRKVGAADSGVYTCAVEHPDALLSKTQNISIVVVPDNSDWLESQSGVLVLVSSLAVTCGLSALAAALSIYVYRRKNLAKAKPIDDRSQIKPIYKSSVETLLSTCGDNQPLVAV